MEQVFFFFNPIDECLSNDYRLFHSVDRSFSERLFCQKLFSLILDLLFWWKNVDQVANGVYFDARISMIASNYISVLLTDVSVPYFAYLFFDVDSILRICL